MATSSRCPKCTTSPAQRRIINGRIDPALCRHTLINSDGTCGWCWEQISDPESDA